jgi:hypothetical protein
MNTQTAKFMAAQNQMHFHYVPKWRLWGLYHLQNLDRPAEYISPRQLKEFSEKEFLRLIKLVRGIA